jgi:hypothetical protein
MCGGTVGVLYVNSFKVRGTTVGDPGAGMI